MTESGLLETLVKMIGAGFVTLLVLFGAELVYDSVRDQLATDIRWYLVGLCITIAGAISVFFFLVELVATGRGALVPGVIIGIGASAYLFRGSLGHRKESGEILINLAEVAGLLLICRLLLEGSWQLASHVNQMLTWVEISEGPIWRAVVAIPIPLMIAILVYRRYRVTKRLRDGTATAHGTGVSRAAN